MKKILSIFAVLMMALSARSQIVTATVTVTNAPVNTSTLTIQGYTFTWTNGTPVGNFAVLITNTFGGDATNLATVATNAIAQFGITVANGGSNIVQFSRAVTVTTNYTTAWATVTLTTNGGSPPSVLVSPISGGGITAVQQTNVISQHVLDLNVDSTNALDQSAPVASQLVGTNNDQSIGGNKLFVGTLSGTVGHLTNGDWTNPILTNAQNFGNPFRSPGLGSGSEQFGLAASAITNFAVAFGDGASAQGVFSSAYGYRALTKYDFDISIGGNSVADGGFSTAIGGEADGTNSTAIGYSSLSAYSNSTAIGFASTTTNPRQIMLGTSSEFVQFPGGVLFKGTETNITTAGTNSFGGILTYPRFLISTVAASNNIINPGTNSYIVLTGSPGAAFSVCSFQSTGAVIDGRFLIVENDTGNSMTIANQSGFDPSASQRIYTGTSSDITLTGNPQLALFVYSSWRSAWVYLGLASSVVTANVTATTVNATASLIIGASTNTPSLTLVNTNWIDGGTYTNQTGRPIFVTTPCKVLPGTGIGGNATFALQVPGTVTNVLSVGTLATSLAMSQTNQVHAFVTNGGIFTFTNVSSGTGSSAAILVGGQYMVY